MKADDEKAVAALQDIQDQLAFVRAALEELLRRVPIPKCKWCGLAEGYHQGHAADHEFTP